MQRRKFEAGFKQQIVSDDESGMLSVNPASRKYQLSGNVIDRWRQQACHGGLEATPWAREKTPERENRELKGKPDFSVISTLRSEARRLRRVRGNAWLGGIGAHVRILTLDRLQKAP